MALKLSSVVPEKYFAYIPDKLYIQLVFLQQRKKLLNLRNPKTYAEKIQWIKLYAEVEQYTDIVDKYEVRKYIKKVLGEKYLIPLIGSWDTYDEIPIADLPQQFALMATHGSGYIFICKDKSKLDEVELKTMVNKWLNSNFYQDHRERQYKNIRPRILCEPYLEDEFGELRDYKFTCFGGVPQLIEVHSSLAAQHTVTIFDTNWKRMPFKSVSVLHDPEPPKPENLDELMAIAKKLAKPFPFVRVDLYSIHGRAYFGEFSFSPCDGYPFEGEGDRFLGDMLDISLYK